MPLSPPRVHCPAKVNLALAVGAPEPPSNFHPIASWMVATDFGDDLTVEPLPSGSPPRLNIRFAAGNDAALTRRPLTVDWPLEKDLAWRALGLLHEHTGKPISLRADLIKRIPPGGGLGGGSSDAAAMLVAANRVLNLGLDLATLQSLAARLGSDVSYLVAAVDAAMRENAASTTSGAGGGGDSGGVLATGRGDHLESLPARPPIHLVLIFPPFGCPTGPVYGAFDKLHGHAPGASPRPDGAMPDGHRLQTDRVRALVAAAQLNTHDLFNDLADPACIVEPRLADVRRRASAILGQTIHVTGSGSTLFVLANDAPAATEHAHRVRDQLNLDAVATRTL
ncbi:MAG: hypothetical protein IT442_02735 [Phycisphaeraceae bacterium]|nr:hypothetical protein [Phycisphaeraceae bacterium]